MEIANAVDPVQDGRIFIELINGPFLFEHKSSPAEYGAGLKLAIERGWLWKHESGIYVKLTQAGANVRLRLPPLPARLARSSIAKRNRAHHLPIFTGDDKNAIFCRKFWARLGQ
jgi:hypothetical protein